ASADWRFSSAICKSSPSILMIFFHYLDGCAYSPDNSKFYQTSIIKGMERSAFRLLLSQAINPIITLYTPA
ncbi:hypothetical protein PENTCL1PPCAC_21772, partial [Pristionchus entomophagus]